MNVMHRTMGSMSKPGKTKASTEATREMPYELKIKHSVAPYVSRSKMPEGVTLLIAMIQNLKAIEKLLKSNKKKLMEDLKRWDRAMHSFKAPPEKMYRRKRVQWPTQKQTRVHH
ncbi:hypothetical protein Pr1d_50580 [Bythopirellula goksoeyrii]|uniref:Uncharacterized protein n=1 Tax=Bythopirellula goksoeyrii TaxID=1400387 RepID=A0A5B9QJ20_9BACT|nr:hypothetical protein Pr1d_50580 [Bythopirellula goksoeyrii]